MPTVLRIDGYRFFFFSDDHLPVHIHIEKGNSYARIEIATLKVTNKYQISSKELSKLVKLVGENQQLLKGAWDEYFSQS